MANFRQINIENNKVWEHINLIVKDNAQFYEKIRIRCLSFRSNNNEYQNILCVIKTFTKETIPQETKNQIHKYSNISLFENWYDIRNFELSKLINQEKKDNIILNLNGNGTPQVQDVVIKLDMPLTLSSYSFEPFDNDYSELSGHLYTSNNRLPNNIDRSIFTESILSYEKPLYPSGFQAIKEWCELKEFNNDMDTRMGSVIIFLSEGRAGFKSISNKEGKLKIETRLSDNKLKEKLKVKILWIVNGQRKNLEYKFDKEINCDIPMGLESVYIYLIDMDETVYDYCEETGYRTYGKCRIIGINKITNDLQEIVINALKTSENENIEFKPYIKPDNNKWDEVIKTVIAFANKQGGNIIFGINDNVYVEGIEKSVNKEFEKYKQNKGGLTLSDNPEEWYKGIIKKIIGNKISGQIKLDIKSFFYENEHLIIIINVPEGMEKPYYNTETKDTYIRQGGNNKKASPADIMALRQKNNNIWNID